MKKLLMLSILVCSCFNKDYLNPEKLVNKKGFNWEIDKVKNINIYFLTNQFSNQQKNELKLKLSIAFDNILKITEIPKYDKEVSYFIVDTPERVDKLTSRKVSGIAFPFSQTVVAIHQQNASAVSEHELYHVISIDTWGKSTEWLQEGTAVDADKLWFNYPLHNLCNYMKKKNLLIPLPKLIKSFRKEKSMISYPQVGSFVQYLIQKYGLKRLKEFWKNQDFELIYKKNIEQLEKDWLDEISNFSTATIIYNP